jgi:hypothetical protein
MDIAAVRETTALDPVAAVELLKTRSIGEVEDASDPARS